MVFIRNRKINLLKFNKWLDSKIRWSILKVKHYRLINKKHK